MRADGVVEMPPASDDDLSVPQRVEDLAVEQFVLQARIKTFGKAVLPRAAWRDVGGLPRRFVQELAEAFGRDRRVMTPASVKKRPAHASFAQCCPGCCPTTISRNVRVRKRFITH